MQNMVHNYSNYVVYLCYRIFVDNIYRIFVDIEDIVKDFQLSFFLFPKKTVRLRVLAVGGFLGRITRSV